MKESTYIDLLTDFGFKKAFGKENQSEEFLIDFLNELFKDDSELNHIISIRYKNLEKSPNYRADKGIRYDLLCKTSTGHHFIVEMQRQNQKYFADRVTYYLCRELVEQLPESKVEGDEDYKLIPVVGVFLTNFTVNGLDRKLVVNGKFIDPETGKVVLDKLKCAFVQLDQFDKTPEECHTGFEKWVYILKNMERLQEIPFQTYKNQIFQRLGELSKVANLTDEERRLYQQDLKWARDYRSSLAYERDEGIAIGEKRVARAMATKMLAKGYAISEISELTGLSGAELEGLK